MWFSDSSDGCGVQSGMEAPRIPVNSELYGGPSLWVRCGINAYYCGIRVAWSHYGSIPVNSELYGGTFLGVQSGMEALRIPVSPEGGCSILVCIKRNRFLV